MAYELWRPGMKITAARLNAGVAGEWKSWTPEWSTTGGSFGHAFGNASVDAQYVVGGRTCHFNVTITFGSTTNFGTDLTANWTFGLPVSAAVSSSPIGYASLFTGDTAGSGQATSALLYVQTVDTVIMYIQSAPQGGQPVTNEGVVDSQAPFTWASGHRLDFSGTYQIA